MMTPRLNQLAEEAGFFPTELTQVGPSVEKFAQIIMHECIHAVENHNAQAYQVSDPKNISQIIQDHFKE
jgi:hypothetical protein